MLANNLHLFKLAPQWRTVGSSSRFY